MFWHDRHMQPPPSALACRAYCEINRTPHWLPEKPEQHGGCAALMCICAQFLLCAPVGSLTGGPYDGAWNKMKGCKALSRLLLPEAIYIHTVLN